MVGTQLMRDSVPKKPAIRSFLWTMASSLTLLTSDGPTSRLTDVGHHISTIFPSFENTNLFHAGPHRNAICSPSREVRKTDDLYSCTRSATNLSGHPLLLYLRNSNVSPRNGHPDLPGGRLWQARRVTRLAPLKRNIEQARRMGKRRSRAEIGTETDNSSMGGKDCSWRDFPLVEVIDGIVVFSLLIYFDRAVVGD